MNQNDMIQFFGTEPEDKFKNVLKYYRTKDPVLHAALVSKSNDVRAAGYKVLDLVDNVMLTNEGCIVAMWEVKPVSL